MFRSEDQDAVGGYGGHRQEDVHHRKPGDERLDVESSDAATAASSRVIRGSRLAGVALLFIVGWVLVSGSTESLAAGHVGAGHGAESSDIETLVVKTPDITEKQSSEETSTSVSTAATAEKTEGSVEVADSEAEVSGAVVVGKTRPEKLGNAETGDDVPFGTGVSFPLGTLPAGEPLVVSAASGPVFDHGSHEVAETSAHRDSGMKLDHARLDGLIGRVRQQVETGTAAQAVGGEWTSPSSWAAGVVPGANSDVYIPAGVSISYGTVSDVRIGTVAVDGELSFATDRDSRLILDTLVTGPNSVLKMGSTDDPVEVDVRVEVVIRSDVTSVLDPARIEIDPSQLGHGVITHGTVRVHGADKADFDRVIENPMTGDTSLTFAAAPTGWRVGDRLVVVGTRTTGTPIGPRRTTQDEVVAVTSIDGGVVGIDRALEFDHDVPANAPGGLVPVANYTRNVFFGSERADEQGLRGHIMFMHNADVEVRNTEFFEMGRSNKAKVHTGESTSEPLYNVNSKGRYALHVHRTGAKNKMAVIEGNAVWGSPGWGIVHHDSNAAINSNAVYGVNGAGIVSENGNETGEWVGNIVVRTNGVFPVDNHGGPFSQQANKERTGGGIGESAEPNDIFASGNAMAMSGRGLLPVHGNITAGSQAGYTFARSGIEVGVDFDAFAELNGFDPHLGVKKSVPNLVPNRLFFDNYSYANNIGLFTTSHKQSPPMDKFLSLVEHLVGVGNRECILGAYQKHSYVFKESYCNGNGVRGKTTGLPRIAATHFNIVNSHFENLTKAHFGTGNRPGEGLHQRYGNTYERIATAGPCNCDEPFDDHVKQTALTAAGQSPLPTPSLSVEVDVSSSDLVVEHIRGAGYKPGNIEIVVTKTDGAGTKPLSLASPRKFFESWKQEWWAQNLDRKGFWDWDGKVYATVDVAVSERVTSSVGAVPVAILIDLPREQILKEAPKAVSNGDLPAEFRDDLVGEFRMVDCRNIGTFGPQNCATWPSATPDPVPIRSSGS